MIEMKAARGRKQSGGYYVDVQTAEFTTAIERHYARCRALEEQRLQLDRERFEKDTK